jgi:hypothetical protein
MIRVVRAETNHVWMIKPKAIFYEGARDDVHRAIKHNEAISIFAGNQIMAIIGFTPIYKETGEMWALTSDLCSKYPLAFHRKVKELLEYYTKLNKLRRVQMVVRRGYSQGFDWAVSLGFEPEGILRKYGPEGDDYVMMGRV